jgi:hypothetical protein
MITIGGKFHAIPRRHHLPHQEHAHMGIAISDQDNVRSSHRTLLLQVNAAISPGEANKPLRRRAAVTIFASSHQRLLSFFSNRYATAKQTRQNNL